MGGTYSTRGTEVNIKFCWEILKERDQLGAHEQRWEYGFKWMLKEQFASVSIGFIWREIGISGGLFVT
jgi:hypothetical protein